MTRRARVVALTVVAAAALTGCRGAAEPGGPGGPTASPTAEPTDGPTSTPTTEPTTTPTDPGSPNPGGPTPPGGSDGVEVSVEIEEAFTMPNLVETRLKQARADLSRDGATSVVVVDARGTGPLAGAANGWTVCTQDPAGGELVRVSRTVTLRAAPNARHCP